MMNAAQFEQALLKLGWTQRHAAEKFGVTEGAVSRWVNGERRIPGPIIVLLTQYLATQKPST